MPHDEFEIAIEKRLHGALPPEELEALERHLSTCQDCSQYERQSRTEQAGVREMFATHNRSIDWNLVQERVESTIRSLRRLRRTLPLTLVATVALQLAIFVWAGGRILPALFSFALTAPLSAFLAYRVARNQGRAAESRLAQSGALAFYRSTVDRGIRETKVLVGVTPLAVIALVICARVADDRETWAGVVVFGSAWLALGLGLLLVKLPRLRREREELR